MAEKNSIFIIAEVGNLHNGSVESAKDFVKTAAECGADAVKFQTHIFDAESLPDAPTPSFYAQESRKNYLERTAFTAEEWKELREYSQKRNIEFMSSVFSLEAVDLLEDVGVERYKIPSGEVTNLPLLEKIGPLGKPVLLSSGMSSWKEIDNAVETLRSSGCVDLTVMQCTSLYPCPENKVGINIMPEMKQRYGCRVGFSDHTLKNDASFAAITSGAEVIERHLTLSQNLQGSDAKHSLLPDEFSKFVEEVKDGALGVVDDKNFLNVNKDQLVEELKGIKVVFEKSIVAKQDIPKGEEITFDKLAFKKPGDGIRADRYREIIGRETKIDISANTKIKDSMLVKKV